MGDFIQPADLAPFATIPEPKALAMIADAEAMAKLSAPCLKTLGDLTDEQKAAAKAIIRGAVLRWADVGAGSVTTKTAGPFGQTVDTTRRNLYWPSEIKQLQDICASVDAGKAWSFSRTAAMSTTHAEACALDLGANYCDCGADLAGMPLYE
ncbi:hypothetical protein [Nocardia sp. NPDC059239]|uniref:hypothetical protein n=1 Tax=unclassified Nocardia TaxID=2637762 RepID=UPI0036AF1369